MNKNSACCLLLLSPWLLFPVATPADEGLFGYVRGSETLPKGAWDFEQWFTSRTGKDVGTYQALDTKTEFDYGVTDRFQVSGAMFGLGINTQDIRINAYVPADASYPWKPSGLEGSVKYNFLSPAKDDIGLSQYTSLSYFSRDMHSGQDKDSYSFETILILQKYFMEGELIAAGNLGLEATSAKRAPIAGLPDDFEWPTHPEMEIEVTVSGGLSYRFAPSWFVGAEFFYQTEHETVVGQERWSFQAGPTLHYGAEKWWATLTWMPQLAGGGTFYDGQVNTNLHLIEKTVQEIRFKVGYNF